MKGNKNLIVIITILFIFLLLDYFNLCWYYNLVTKPLCWRPPRPGVETRSDLKGIGASQEIVLSSFFPNPDTYVSEKFKMRPWMAATPSLSWLKKRIFNA